MAEHNVNTVKAQIQSLIDLANETTGNSDTNLTDGVNALVSGYGQGGDLPTDTLVGLENGYDVMFYDENNKGLAFYSIRQGQTINPPIYSGKWQKSDGAIVDFPYTPTEDTLLYILQETYADILYNFYGIDNTVYPYLYLYYDNSKGWSTIVFASTYTISNAITFGYGYSNTVRNVNVCDEDLKKTVNNVIANIHTLTDYTKTANITSFFNTSTRPMQFINFDPTELGYTETVDYIRIDV